MKESLCIERRHPFEWHPCLFGVSLKILSSSVANKPGGLGVVFMGLHRGEKTLYSLTHPPLLLPASILPPSSRCSHCSLDLSLMILCHGFCDAYVTLHHLKISSSYISSLSGFLFPSFSLPLSPSPHMHIYHAWMHTHTAHTTWKIKYFKWKAAMLTTMPPKWQATEWEKGFFFVCFNLFVFSSVTHPTKG